MLGAIGASMDYLSALPADRTLDSEESKSASRIFGSPRDRPPSSRAASSSSRAAVPSPFTRGRVRLCNDVVRLIRHTFDRAIQIDAGIHPGLSVRGDQPSCTKC